MRTVPRLLSFLTIGLALVLAGCSGDSSGNPLVASTTSSSIAATTTTTTTTSPVSTGAVADLAGVRGAVVRIVASGSFADPGEGVQYNTAGSGSGFIIDPSGIAVTNNHVVGGAAFLEVYLAGDTEPRNARILGISECSDLAVIDIEGDGYPYLEWSNDALAAGTQIYAAGFPLGDPEYTLIDGIISKENADGESDWASVDRVIEHSGDTLPGSSGGPIVGADGRVLAVNYAGDSFGQSYGIARSEAVPVIEQLRAGNDVDSIGINGYAFVSDGFAGIWVSSVSAGTPAGDAGVKAGDVITLIEGIIPGMDGTMADFCDVLRTNGPDDPMSLEVYRDGDGLAYEGTLNGQALAAVTGPDVFIDSGGGDGGATLLPAGTPYSGYETVTDDSGSLVLEVPTAWSDRITVPWNFGGDLVGPAITASPDANAFVERWDTPGVFIAASSDIVDQGWTVDDLWQAEDFSESCVSSETGPYDDGLYTGVYEIWTECGGVGSWFIVVVAEDAARSTLFLVEVVLATEADAEAFDQITATFSLVGDTGGASGGGTVLGVPALIADVAPGTCFDDADWGDDGTIVPVSCDDSHDNEVIYNYLYDDVAWPGFDALDAAASAECLAVFPGYVGIGYEESLLIVAPVLPTEDVWASGDRIISCVVYDLNFEQLIGSTYQSGY